jgi:hypothetical protein
MAWKCDGCGATNQDPNGVCEYCGRHQISKAPLVKTDRIQDIKEGNSIQGSNDFMNKIDTALNPTQNYKSTEKSIKPNFESKGGVSTENIIIGIVILLFFVWLIS